MFFTLPSFPLSSLSLSVNDLSNDAWDGNEWITRVKWWHSHHWHISPSCTSYPRAVCFTLFIFARIFSYLHILRSCWKETKFFPRIPQKDIRYLIHFVLKIRFILNNGTIELRILSYNTGWPLFKIKGFNSKKLNSSCSFFISLFRFLYILIPDIYQVTLIFWVSKGF